MIINTNKLVSGQQLLADLFAEDIRPGLQWLRKMRKARIIPYLQIGGLVLYDTDAVRESLIKKNYIRSV